MPVTVIVFPETTPVVCQPCRWRGRAIEADCPLDGVVTCPKCHGPLERGTYHLPPLTKWERVKVWWRMWRNYGVPPWEYERDRAGMFRVCKGHGIECH